MLNTDSQILKFINDLQQNESKFFNGSFLGENEKDYIKAVEIINYNINKIQNENIRKRATDFVNKIFKHKNYTIYKEQQKIKEENAKQDKKDKELSFILISEIKELLNNYNFDAVEKLYLKNKAIIDRHQSEFAKYWQSLPRNRKDDSIISCKKILKHRKIKNLIHFTSIKNLPSILENSLLPKEKLDEKQLIYDYNDELRLENRLDCICLSIEYPNISVLNKFKTKYNKKYCILVLDAESILLNNNDKKYYVYCNAARGDARKWLQDDTLCQDRYFHALFLQENQDSRNFFKYSRSEKRLKDYLPTNIQAEILYQGTIPPNYIKKIYFENLIDLENFQQKIDKVLIKNIELLCDNSFFIKNREEIEWEER